MTAPRRKPPVQLGVLVLVLFSACFGARAPHVPPNGTLAPGDGDAAGGSNGAFRVVFTSPRGSTDDTREVTVVFSRPMRALDLAGDEAAPPLSLKPAVPGQWRWIGSSGLVFEPADHLPRATAFTIDVPQATHALDGTALEKAYSSSFTTPRPKLVHASVPDQSPTELEPNAAFDLRFNQPVDVDEVARGLKLLLDGKAPLPFDLTRPDPKDEQRLLARPRAKLPLDAKIDVRVPPGLHGTEGPLGSEAEQVFPFHTYGPFTVRYVTCSRDTPHGKCAPDSSLVVQLSSSVDFKALKRALRIEPGLAIHFPGWMHDGELVRSVSISGRFQAGRSYRVSVGAAGLRDEHKQPLARDYAEEIAFDDFWPSAEIGVWGSLIEPSTRKTIPVASLNVTALDLTVAPLDRAAVLAIEAKRAHTGGPTIDDVKALAGAKVTALRPAGATNRPWSHDVHAEEVLGGKDRRGPIAIGIGYTEKPGTRAARLTNKVRVVQVTDLAISAKISSNGSLVWVTRLSDAAPVAGATVSIARQGDTPTEFATNADGLAEVPASAFEPAHGQSETAVVFARRGDDWTFRPVSRAFSEGRTGVEADFGPERPIGLVFTDRGVYRPGETVHLKGIFREPAAMGTTTPAGKRVLLAVAGPDGEAITTSEIALDTFGALATDVKIPDSARLGTYSVAATAGDRANGADVTEDFQVAEFRPAEFKASIESSRPSYVRGDAASWIGRGDFLFGAPMAGAHGKITVTRRATTFTPPGAGAWTVDDEAYESGRRETNPHDGSVQTTSSTLDAHGAMTSAASLTMPGQKSTESVTAEIEVMDLSRQTVASSTTAMVHPAEYYVGLHAVGDRFVKAGDTVKVEVTAIDPAGHRTNGASVRLELLARTWVVAKQAVGGGLRNFTEPHDESVGSCVVETAAKPMVCELVTRGSGYYVVHATSVDKRKNPVSASYGIYATGEGTPSWGDDDPTKLDLVADRTSYEPGQTARVLVKSPWKKAEALVTVERAGISSQRRMVLTGATPVVEVPITSELRPNAFVSVLLVRGRSKAAPAALGAADVGAPSFRLGYAELPIDPEARRLGVTLKPSKAALRPGETLDVDVDVHDGAGKPAKAEVTLYAADEGVLSLVSYATPDPIGVFGAARSLRVATAEARASLARIVNPFGELGLDKGLEGGGGGLEPGVRHDFRPSAYYNPALLTDGAGHAHVTFKLPDGLTTYRIMAVAAAEDDRFGYAQERVTTSKPLMARPAVPRFVRAGDTLEAGVVVTSKLAAKAAIDVDVVATGLTLVGGAKKAVTLDSGESAEVRFAMEAREAGSATLRFHAVGGGEDQVQVGKTVQTPAVLEAVALYGETKHAAAEKLGDVSSIRSDVGSLEVSLASTALVGLGGGVEQLVQYPYGCTEQLTSRLVPLVPLRSLAADFHLTLPRDVDAIVRKAVVDILAHQKSDGGFGLWKDSAEANPWTTTYALWGLAVVKARGVEVPQRALDQAKSYLTSQLASSNDDPMWQATAPFVVDVLAEAGWPDPARVNRLFEVRDQLPLFSKALLLHAMVLSKSDRASIDKLASEIEGHLRLDGAAARAVENLGDQYAELLDSDARTSALVLRAFELARPGHPLAARLARGLLADRKGGTWRSTQETAWALLALDDYRKVEEKNAPDFVGRAFLGETELLSAPFVGRTVANPHVSIAPGNVVAQAGQPLGFSVDGTGTLFYEARLRYARKQLPRKPLERGFFVRKTLRPVTAESLETTLAAPARASATRFEGGSLVLGEIDVVTASPRTFVVIDDPLPAGFEAVDTRLATTSSGLDVDAHSEDGGDHETASEFVREVRDDRVLFFVDHLPAGRFRYRYLARATTIGTFILPPTKAEEMYTPEVFGRTGSDVVKVVAP